MQPTLTFQFNLIRNFQSGLSGQWVTYLQPNFFSIFHYQKCEVQLDKKKYQIVGDKAKSESQNEYYKKTKHGKFSEKRTFPTPWNAHVYVRIRG